MKIQQGYLTEESGAWIGHFSRWITDARTGDRRRQQRAFRIGALNEMTKTAAKEKLRERMVSELGLTADSRMTFAAFAEYRWKPLREGTWRDSTKQTNKELLNVITNRFGSVALEDLDDVQMQRWLNELAKNRSGSMVKHCRTFLKSICAEAIAQGHIRRDPARGLRIPRVRPILRPYVSEIEIDALFKACKYQLRERVLLELILMTALRPSELFALRWKCVSEQFTKITLFESVYRGVLRPFTKTTQQGDTQFVTQYVPVTVALTLAEWCGRSERNEPEDFVFCTESGGFWWKENYQRRVLTPLAHDAGIKKVNFQMLRRSVATHLQDKGSPKDIATIMRHRSAETAQQHYVQTVDASVRPALDKLAEKLFGN